MAAGGSDEAHYRWVNTNVLAREIVYTWKIDNIINRLSRKLSSPLFGEGNEWMLTLQKHKHSDDFMSISLNLKRNKDPRLRCAPSQEDLYAAVSFHVLDEAGNKTNSFFASGFFKITTNHSATLDDFLEIETLKNPDCCFILNGVLTIRVEIALMTSVDNFIEFTDRSTSLATDLCILHDAETLSDVTLVAGGTSFKAHRAILAARSPVFKAMFESDMSEKSDGVVKLDDMTEETLKEFLEFIYTDQTPNISPFATQLLVSADKYQVTGLLEACEDELTSTLAVSNAVERLILANLINAYQLRKSAVKFIAWNLYDIQQNESWTMLENDHPALAFDLLKEAGQVLRELQ